MISPQDIPASDCRAPLPGSVVTMNLELAASLRQVPTRCHWNTGGSTPLANFNEQSVRDFAEWMRREIIKQAGYPLNVAGEATASEKP